MSPFYPFFLLIAAMALAFLGMVSGMKAEAAEKKGKGFAVLFLSSVGAWSGFLVLVWVVLSCTPV